VETSGELAPRAYMHIGLGTVGQMARPQWHVRKVKRCLGTVLRIRSGKTVV
jgi:hypothetical protein